MFRVLGFAWALLLGACASVYNVPTNLPLTDGSTIGESAGLAVEDDALIGLAFSGGGTRAAAFSFGVLTELDREKVRVGRRTVSMLDRVDSVSGVSGGSVIAAYFGLRKRAALTDFRERFLLRDPERALNTEVSLATLGRALGGGVNDATGFQRWLDANLFGGATFADIHANRRPRIWINASDIYNRTPFVFDSLAFEAMCSDLSRYALSHAVAASAAVPVVFAPVVLETYPGVCAKKLPAWIAALENHPNAQPLLRAFASAITRYRDGSMRYVKLMDGGLVDNFGLSGFTIGLLSATRPYEPATAEQAVKLRRILFVVADAGRAPSGDWTQRLEGPSGVELVMAAADTATGASERASYAVFDTLLNDWGAKLRRWRCGLSAAERQRLGVPAGWNCGDLKIYVERLSFDQLGPERAAVLNAIPTRFRLPAESVDALIAAGSDALRNSAKYQAFRRHL